MQFRSKRLVPGLAAVGLVTAIAVGGAVGSASAKSQIHGSDIAHNTITGANVKTNSLTGGDIANQSIHSVDIAAGGVGSSEIRNQSIQSVDIAPNGVGSSEIRAGAVGLSEISSSAKAALKGATGKTGAPGKNGTNGAKGDKGDPGVKGDKGADGKNALDGAVFRVENYQNGGGGSATVACADNDADSQKYIAIAGGVQGSESGKTETQSGFLVSSSFPGRMDWNTGEPKPGRLDGWIVFGNSQHTSTLKVWALCVPKTNDVPVVQVDLDN